MEWIAYPLAVLVVLSVLNHEFTIKDLKDGESSRRSIKNRNAEYTINHIPADNNIGLDMAALPKQRSDSHDAVGDKLEQKSD